MPLTIKNQVFITSLPDVDGLITIVCLTNPELSFTLDLGINSLNDEATQHFDRILLSSPPAEYRYEQARNPGPLLAENHIASMKFTNVRHSFAIYWSNRENSDKVVVRDILKNTIMEKTGLSIGSQQLRDFFLENFPLRIRINTSSLQDQYLAIMSATSHHESALIEQVSYDEIHTNRGMAPQILQNIDRIITEMRREYNIDVDALTERFARDNTTLEEKEEIPPPYTPPPYTPTPYTPGDEPPAYNETCA